MSAILNGVRLTRCTIVWRRPSHQSMYGSGNPTPPFDNRCESGSTVFVSKTEELAHHLHLSFILSQTVLVLTGLEARPVGRLGQGAFDGRERFLPYPLTLRPIPANACQHKVSVTDVCSGALTVTKSWLKWLILGYSLLFSVIPVIYFYTLFEQERSITTCLYI